MSKSSNPLAFSCLVFFSLFFLTSCDENEPEFNFLDTPEFIQQAVTKDMLIMAVTRMATQKAVTPQVRQFSQHLVTSYSQSHIMLQDFANQQNVIIPDSMHPEQMAIRNHLRTLSGTGFDKAYVQVQVQAHEDIIAWYERAHREIRDDEVKAFIDYAVPMYQQHLDNALKLQEFTDEL
jgi:putative membrane protein